MTDFRAVALPSLPSVTAAREVASRHCSPALLNHSVRSYLWAQAYARVTGLDFDSELLAVAALLHDIGLTDAFDSNTVPFEIAGGEVAWVFAAGAGWPDERRDRVAEIMILHMREDVPASTDAESHLLQVSTSFDVSGWFAEHFPEELRADVLARYPRLDFGAEFVALCAQQARRKPTSAAAALVAGGVAGRIAANPLDR